MSADNGQKMLPEQCRFSLSDGRIIAAQRWGRGGRQRVIALHGWLDNCASFSLLAPELLALADIDIVALDLAGNGQSDNAPGEGAYNIWLDLPDIAQVIEQLAWSKLSFLAHSRGAMVASIYTGTFPGQVSKLCLIDAIAPVPIEANSLPGQLAMAITAQLSSKQASRSYFASFDEAVNARTKGLFPLSLSAAKLLGERSLMQSEQGYFWHYDYKHRLPSEIKLSRSQVLAFIQAFPCTAKVILADRGILNGDDSALDLLDWYTQQNNLDIVFMEGDHHLHLAENATTVRALAATINDYFASA